MLTLACLPYRKQFYCYPTLPRHLMLSVEDASPGRKQFHSYFYILTHLTSIYSTL